MVGASSPSCGQIRATSVDREIRIGQKLESGAALAVLIERQAVLGRLGRRHATPIRA